MRAAVVGTTAAGTFAGGEVTDERRTVHIGVDLTLPSGSPLYAPFDGVVHGFEDTTARLDYGPVIVLRHEIPGDEPPRIGGERKLLIWRWGASYYFQFWRDFFIWH